MNEDDNILGRWAEYGKPPIIYVLSQRDMDDESLLQVVSAHRTMQGAVSARAAIWADEDFQEIYGGNERDHFVIAEYPLHD